ncbi:MAG: SEC-C metal-binding domain-containing protein [Deltaproteobacteria bacterium]|nr:SEC-C metal-binding domain-containing protein [Deltaproteobacteria bacterium]
MPSVPSLSFTTAADRLVNVLTNEVNVSVFKALPLAKDFRPFKAIWDTGATHTVVTKKVAEECGLSQIDIAETHAVGGTFKTSVYLISLVLPNKILISPLRVTEGDLGTSGDVLIGMDIIGLGDFAVSNYDNRTLFSFRMPSESHFDFTGELAKHKKLTSINVAKPGRNEPCSCGSGKKYKHCCLNK